MSAFGSFALRVRGFGNITVAAASAAVDLTALIPSGGGIGARVCIVSSTAAFWRSGKTSPTAVTTDAVVPANTPMVFDLPPGHRYVAAIQVSAGGSLTVYVLDN